MNDTRPVVVLVLQLPVGQCGNTLHQLVPGHGPIKNDANGQSAICRLTDRYDHLLDLNDRIRAAQTLEELSI